MSTPIAQYKLPSRIEIGFDSETKASIADLKVKLDEVNKNLNARNSGLWSESKKKSNSRIGQIIATAISKQIKETVHPDGLLKAMQSEAANDAPVTSSPWENDLNRETVNDVDYLSGSDLDECVPHIDEVLDQPNWLSESVPQITQADMQLIFIKNLSETLIQRMHSMERFSEDDYHIGGTDLMTWDIVTGNYNDKVVYGVVTGTQINSDQDTNKIDIVRLRPKFLISDACATIGATTSIYFNSNKSFCTITEAELPAFRAALEACYA